MGGNVYYQACWEQAANTFYLHGEPARSAGISADGGGGCWEPVGCVSLLGPSPWVTSESLNAAKQLLWGITDFTLHETFSSFSLQIHLVSGDQVPLENSFISLDMNNLHQSLLWLAWI